MCSKYHTNAFDISICAIDVQEILNYLKGLQNKRRDVVYIFGDFNVLINSF
jgi:hypothetical protein